MPMSVAALCYPVSCQGPSVHWTTKTTASFTAIAPLHFNLNVTNWDSTSRECLRYHSAGTFGASRTGRAIPIRQGLWSMAVFSDRPRWTTARTWDSKMGWLHGRKENPAGSWLMWDWNGHPSSTIWRERVGFFFQKPRRMIPVIRHNNRSRRVSWCCCCFFNESKWPDCW